MPHTLANSHTSTRSLTPSPSNEPYFRHPEPAAVLHKPPEPIRVPPLPLCPPPRLLIGHLINAHHFGPPKPTAEPPIQAPSKQEVLPALRELLDAFGC